MVTRTDLQNAAAVAAWDKKQILVEYATGVGKSKIAAMVIERLCTEKQNPRILLVLHSENSRDITWPDELRKWECTPYLQYITMICYPSLKKHVLTDFDLVICDEAHYLTDTSFNYFFIRNKPERLLLMTATIPKVYEKKQLLLGLCNQNVISFKVDEAVANNILNDYEIRICSVDLTAEERAEYFRLTAWMQRSEGTVYYDAIIRKRMRFIYNLESKTAAGKWISENLKGQRRVIFCGSKAQCNKISKNRYYSGIPTTAYEQFRDGLIDELVCIKMIQEGANIDNLGIGIILQANSNDLNMIQKMGRLMRLGEGKTAKIYLVMAKDTVDEVWVKRSVSSLNKAKIAYFDISTIIKSQIN